MSLRFSAGSLVFALLVAACGNTGATTTEGTITATVESTTTTVESTTTSGAPAASSTTTTTPAPEGPVIEVEAADYSFVGLPETAVVGTVLTMVNTSSSEFHEMAITRLALDDDRSFDELLALGVVQMGYAGKVSGFLAARPGEPSYLGRRGGLLLSEPGRYLVFCAIPVGADPVDMERQYAEFPLAAQVEGVPAHAEVGQIAEIFVYED